VIALLAAQQGAAGGAASSSSSPSSLSPVPGLPQLAAYHALSTWQTAYSTTDVKNYSYTQVYQTLQSDAHRNATIVAYIKQFLRINDATAVRQPTADECNDSDATSVFERGRAHVNVRITARQSSVDTSTSGTVVKDVYLCGRNELQSMEQVERQILVLASEKEHIDSLYDRMLRSGFNEAMIAVYVGGPETKRLTSEQRRELLSRRVILATYAMAAEGTDIATLNTIVFATPRSSITDQAIGRALRDKLTPAIMPYVLDLCDKWCEMTDRMYYTRNRSYRLYEARHHTFDDQSSYDAVGAVCWRRPSRTRTQRIVDGRKAIREMTKNAKQREKEEKADKRRQKEEQKQTKKNSKAIAPKKRKRVAQAKAKVEKEEEEEEGEEEDAEQDAEEESDASATEVMEPAAEVVEDDAASGDEETLLDEDETLDEETLDEEATEDDEQTVEDN
jgi:hypothetical protein